MKLTFDYYHNLEHTDLYLCNPDGKELFPIPGENRNIVLRFNDLSELTFEVYANVTLSNGKVIQLEAYDYLETKRLIYVTGIGWFQITTVDEYDSGVVKYKKIKAESYQSVLKNKGFISEERVYCFYNPEDPYDDYYDSSKEDAIPSVLGQLYKQLGILQDLSQGQSEPTSAYSDWTITYISSSLIYTGEGGKCRSFKENVTYGYDWIVNDVEEAFEVVILFDFMNKAIHIMTPDEVTQQANVIYTFNNFMKSVKINESSDDIVTVLNCKGNNCDITYVNPTGTNYICDFSHFMDEENGRWMSGELIAKLKEWERECEGERSNYTTIISNLRQQLLLRTQCATSLQEMSLFLQDLKNAQSKRSVLSNGTSPGTLCGTVLVENVDVGNKSIKSGTRFNSTEFTGDAKIVAYRTQPDYNVVTRRWEFTGESMSGTANDIVAYNLSDDNTAKKCYWYFSDNDNAESYCKLQSDTVINKTDATSSYCCRGFERYIAYCYPMTTTGSGFTRYTDSLQEWIDLRENLVASLNSDDAKLQEEINSITSELHEITKRLNILAYFSDDLQLLRELSCYWIEGDYVNDHIAILDNTTPEEEIDLANELLRSGQVELSKVCQPRFSFSLESLDATKQYEFRDQMRQLELGKIITIEKEEGLWYYPALLEISMNLDNKDSFKMTFGNALRLDDWGYTYADLIAKASSTSRQVNANWQNILAYSKERDEISSLVKDPLDTTLRASFANMVNQEFTIDKNGILGRKRKSETSDEFEEEQMRLINNVLIFTDDNWETARTALGKIYYTDSSGKHTSSYGLIAETLIGSLIMGEKLRIINQDSTVEIGAAGIVIKRKKATNLQEEVFRATSDGTLYVKNYATTSDMETAIQTSSDGIKLYVSKQYATQQSVQSAIELAETGIKLYVTSDTMTETLKGYATTASLDVLHGEVSAKVSSKYGNSQSEFGWSLTSDGFYVYADKSNVVEITSGGLIVSGYIEATSGYIGSTNNGFKINNTYISNGKEKYHDNSTDGIYLGVDGIGLGKGTFWVAKDGFLHAAEGEVAGWEMRDGILFSGKVGLSSAGDSDDSIRIYAGNATASDASFYVRDDGYLFAGSGSIGGWNVTSDLLSSGDVGFSSAGSSSDSIRIYAGSSDPSDAPFYITNDGSLYAAEAYIDGTIIASLGTIGGLSIYQCEISSESSALTFTKDGLIIAEEMFIKNTMQVPRIYADQIAGREGGEGVARLLLQNVSSISSVSVRIEHDIINEGTWNILGRITYEGEVEVTVTTSRLVKNDTPLTVKVRYTTEQGLSHDVQHTVVVQESDTVCKIIVPHLLKWSESGKTHRGTLTATEVAPTTLSVSDIIDTPTIYCNSNLKPLSTTQSIGSLSEPWSDVYVCNAFHDNGAIVTSDISKKNAIEPMGDKYSLLFDLLLPATFKMNNGTSGRIHMGLIAQDLKNAMEVCGIDSTEFAAYCSWEDDDGNMTCGIRYEELISLNINQIQKLKTRVAYLENLIANLVHSDDE